MRLLERFFLFLSGNNDIVEVTTESLRHMDKELGERDRFTDDNGSIMKCTILT